MPRRIIAGIDTFLSIHPNFSARSASTLTLGVGRSFEIDPIPNSIPIDEGISIYPDDSASPITRIKHRFLAPCPLQVATHVAGVSDHADAHRTGLECC